MKIKIIFTILIFAGIVFPQNNVDNILLDGLVGHWEFNEPGNFGKATVGKDLVLKGSGFSSTSGPNVSNGAIRVNKGSKFAVDHNIAANGGGSKVNEFSIVMDIRLPAMPSSSHWFTMYQTDASNSDDGDWFINGDARMGVGATGYTNYAFETVNDWFRIAISVKNGTQYSYYSDGIKRLSGTPQSVDGRFSLGPIFLLFADQNGEDNTIDVADVQLYSRALTDAEIASLGGYGHFEVDSEINPYLQTPTATSIHISWNASPGTESVVEYGTTESLGSSESGTVHVFDDSSRWWHSVKLSDLTPSTKYYYKAKTNNIESDIYSFKTQPASGNNTEHFRFFIVGDNQNRNPEQFSKITSAMEKTANTLYGTASLDESINLIINVGDIVNDGRILHQFDSQFFKPMEALSPYIPTMVSIGNHEREAFNYYHYMEYDDFASPKGEAYYSFKIGRVCFIALNTNNSNDMSDIVRNFNYRTNEQINWLNTVLTDAQNDENIDWIFTYFHHPGHTEISPPSARSYVQDRVIPTLSQYSKAEIVFYGHAHDYERGALADGNLRLLLVGGSGAPLERWGDFYNINYPEIQKTYDHSVYSLIDIDIANKSYSGNTYSLGHDNKPLNNILLDSFHRDKNAVAPPKPSLVSPDSGLHIKPIFYVEAEDISKNYEIMSSQLQVTDIEGDYSNPKVDKIQYTEDIYKDTGTPNYTPIDVNDDLEINRFMITGVGLSRDTTYWWRVRYRDENLQWSEWSDEWSFTNSNPTAILEPSSMIVKETMLYKNYPNPFNPTTTIQFDLKETSIVTLGVYNSLGELVVELENNKLSAGSYSRFFDASNLSSGIYFYKLKANNFVEIKKMTLLK